jgi:RND superfamily putative drug exporter
VWSYVLERVLRRPALSAALSGGALLALALPALTMHTQLPSFTDLPKSLPIVATYDRIQAAFPGAQTPAKVVVAAADVTAPRVQRAIGTLERRALASGQMFKPISTEINPEHTVETVSIPVAGNGDNGTSVAALKTLRDQVIPTSVGRVDGVEAAVTGETAGTHDFNEQMKSHAPLVFAFVLALCFLLLLVTFRSIVVPIKAVLLNLLSVGAAYGLLVLVFQHRFAEGILGFHSNGAITSWLPLFMFVILFGLSMDYHVFILSRIKELVDGGMPTEEAVAAGIKRTAGTVTSAAVVMVAVFAIFVTLRTLDIKQMGFGLAAAILIDSTIVRAVLLPAVMKLLGEWNWYLPRWLEWLPRIGGETAEDARTRDRRLPRAAPALDYD